ncbi:MAG: hypothetical protein ACRCV7_00545 [Culicoidibacterales bacterium]
MANQNQNRVVVDDTRERAQFEKVQRTIEEQRKAALKQKYIQKHMKKYKFFRFSNWILWITIVLLIVAGIFAYNKFLYLGTDYWGKQGGYSRVENRGELNKSAIEKVNKSYELKDGRSARFEQKGPAVNLLVYVPAETAGKDAMQFMNDAIAAFLTELGDAKTAEAPYGKTFMTYDMNIIVTQTDLKKPGEETMYQLGNLSGPEQKITYPFFGTIHKGVMTWTNNIG